MSSFNTTAALHWEKPQPVSIIPGTATHLLSACAHFFSSRILPPLEKERPRFPSSGTSCCHLHTRRRRVASTTLSDAFTSTSPESTISCVKMTADLGFIGAAAYPSPPHYSSAQHRKPSVSSLYDRATMASLSPNQASQRGFSAGPSGQEKTPLSTLNLDFLKAVNEKRTTRGNPGVWSLGKCNGQTDSKPRWTAAKATRPETRQ